MAKRKNPPRAKRSGHLKAGKLRLDLETRFLKRGKKVQQLTPKECALLEAFMNNGGEVLTRKFLMKHVWETDYLGDTRTLDVHIRWLRQKIENDPSEPVLLRTVRGVGYRFEIPRAGKKKL